MGNCLLLDTTLYDIPHIFEKETDMSDKKLGRLVKVGLREGWVSEAGDFTPWLAQDENISLLADAIGLELVRHQRNTRANQVGR
jgi:hypothetical protein